MANYASLKAAIQQVIKTNGNNEITGALLQQSLLAMINSLGAGYQYAGVAVPATAPGTPDHNVFYFAGPGTYPNFNNAVVPSGNIGLFSYNGSWTVSTVQTTPFTSRSLSNGIVQLLDNGTPIFPLTHFDAVFSFVEASLLSVVVSYLLNDNGDEINIRGYNYKKYQIPQGCEQVFISGDFSEFTLTAGWSAAWMVDQNGNMLSYVSVNSEHYVFNRFAFTVPSGAVEVWINKQSSTVEYQQSISEKFDEIEQAINDLGTIVSGIISDITLIKQLNPTTTVVAGWITNNGTIATSPIGGEYNIFDIPAGVTKLYLTATGVVVSPNIAWSLAWVVNSNNGFIRAIAAVSSNVPNCTDLLIDVTNDTGAAKLYVTKCTSCYLKYQTTDEKINEFVAGLDRRVSALENETRIGNNQWVNKKIVWLGTSIPYGQSAADGGRAPHPYPGQIAEKLGCTVENNASPGLAVEADFDSETQTWTPKQSGSLSLTLAEYAAAGQSTPGVKCYENSMLGKNADLYVFDCEPNNYDGSLTDLNNFNVAQWKYNDNSPFASHRNTYVGAIIYLLDKLWTEKPDAKVVLVGEFGNASTYQSDAIHAASVALCEKFRIKYIDLWNILYYNPLNKSQYINTDNVHPKQAGYDRMANILAHELLLIS